MVTGTVHLVVIFYLECQNGVIIPVRQKRGRRGEGVNADTSVNLYSNMIDVAIGDLYTARSWAPALIARMPYKTGMSEASVEVEITHV